MDPKWHEKLTRLSRRAVDTKDYLTDEERMVAVLEWLDRRLKMAECCVPLEDAYEVE